MYTMRTGIHSPKQVGSWLTEMLRSTLPTMRTEQLRKRKRGSWLPMPPAPLSSSPVGSSRSSSAYELRVTEPLLDTNDSRSTGTARSGSSRSGSRSRFWSANGMGHRGQTERLIVTCRRLFCLPDSGSSCMASRILDRLPSPR